MIIVYDNQEILQYILLKCILAMMEHLEEEEAIICV